MDMIRVLQAEESMRHVTEIAAGNGLIKQHDRESILSGWRREAEMYEPKAPKTLGAMVGDGIGLRIVKKDDRR